MEILFDLPVEFEALVGAGGGGGGASDLVIDDMIESPTNCWTQAENALAEALPELAAFQEFCECQAAADPAAAAAEFVFLEELGESLSGRTWTEKELGEVRHYGLVTSARQEAYMIRRTTCDGFTPLGVLVLYLDRLVPPEDEAGLATDRLSRNQVDRWMKNRIGSLMAELAAYWDEVGGPWMVEAIVNDGPYHNHPDEREGEGHWQGAEVLIPWGVRT